MDKVSATNVAEQVAAMISRDPRFAGVNAVDTDAAGYALFVVTLPNGQRFRIDVDQAD